MVVLILVFSKAYGIHSEAFGIGSTMPAEGDIEIQSVMEQIFEKELRTYNCQMRGRVC